MNDCNTATTTNNKNNINNNNGSNLIIFDTPEQKIDPGYPTWNSRDSWT